MKYSIHILALLLFTAIVTGSCQEQKEHTAPAIRERDSVSTMTSYGVNTLISDSGVIKYRIVSERWEVNQVRNPSRWIFEKGLFLEQFDEKFHVYSYIQCDTAFYYDQEKLWELRGRVSILTKDDLRFTSELLYWDQNKHELYSYVHSRLVTPEQTLEGNYFKSDENMTRYTVSNATGSFEKQNFMGGESEPATTAPADTTPPAIRQQPLPRRKSATQG